MKSIQIVAHTHGGIVSGAVQQATEREYDALKSGLGNLIAGVCLEFDTEDGVVIIPSSQIYFVEVKIF